MGRGREGGGACSQRGVKWKEDFGWGCIWQVKEVCCSSEVATDESTEFLHSECVQVTPGQLLQPPTWKEHRTRLVQHGSNLLKINVILLQVNLA